MAKVRFRLQYDKVAQGVHFLATQKPGITQYYIGKVFFFADREHLLDWGRPISGDRYVAMEHGPVPSYIRDLLKRHSDQPDELLDALFERVKVEVEGSRLHFFSSVDNPTYPALSGTDIEYLLAALDAYGSLDFLALKTVSHKDAAYEEAWKKDGLNNEMDPLLWFAELHDADLATRQLLEGSAVDREASQF